VIKRKAAPPLNRPGLVVVHELTIGKRTIHKGDGCRVAGFRGIYTFVDVTTLPNGLTTATVVGGSHKATRMVTLDRIHPLTAREAATRARQAAAATLVQETEASD
jgi:hypothetical protein